jgi:SAGA-associated factor 29
LDQQHANGEETSSTLESELAKLSRENLKLCEDITAALKGSDNNNENSVLSSLDILKALRQSTENDPAPPRTTSTAKASRGKNRKQDSSSVLSADDRESLTAESPMAPSPKVIVPSSTRLKAASSRAGSVPVGREASVKVEEGTESGADGPKRKSFASHIPLNNTLTIEIVDKTRYVKGTEVFYRTKKGATRTNDKDDQGEGILCTITNITGEGKHRKYEIIDVEPDDGTTPYRANLSQMVAIPEKNDGLVAPEVKRTVLAMYPGTTTFYRADVVAVKGKDLPVGHVRLRFEDEDDTNTELVVERRNVLLHWPGQ